MNNNFKNTCARLVFGAIGLLLAASICRPPYAQGENAVVFGSVEPHRGEIIIDGTSTLHAWQVKGDTIQGSLTVLPGADGLPGSDPAVNKFPEGIIMNADKSITARVTIPVRSLASGKSRMDREMFGTLGAEKHEAIVFVLTNLERLPESPGNTSEPYQESDPRVMAKGDLTIGGQTREVMFPVMITPRDKGLRITGVAELKMTDFGLTPPRVLLGMLRTGDRITVAFDWSPERSPE